MNLQEIEPQPIVLPMDSRFYAIPVEYMRDEAIDYVTEQIQSYPDNIKKGMLSGLAVAEMFTTPSEFIDHIQFRKEHEIANSHWLKSKFESEKAALREHTWGTWAIETVFSLMRLYWGLPSRHRDFTAEMILTGIYCRYSSGD